MSGQEDPFSLLAALKERYGVVESCAPFGPSLVIPNSEYRPGWTDLLNRAGLKVFCGERAGRVAWIIPLKASLAVGAGLKDPRSNETQDPNVSVIGTKNPGPGRGCITGRPWTQAEDQQLLAMLDQDRSAREIASMLAPSLDRTERAIKDRVGKLRRRQAVGSNPTLPEERQAKASLTEEGSPEQPAEPQEIRGLLESALLLAEDPRHRPALRVILKACLRLACQNQPQQAGSTSPTPA